MSSDNCSYVFNKAWNRMFISFDKGRCSPSAGGGSVGNDIDTAESGGSRVIVVGDWVSSSSEVVFQEPSCAANQDCTACQ